MSAIFWSVNNVESLDLSSWNTSKVTNMKEMFAYTTSLNEVLVGDGWNTSGADTSAMFAGSKINSVTHKSN